MSLVLASEFVQETRFGFLADQYSIEEIQAKLDEVERNFFGGDAIQLWGVDAIEGAKLLAGHQLLEVLMAQMQVAGAAASIQAGQSVGFQGLPGSVFQANGYESTIFGRQFEALRQQIIPATGFYF